MHVAVWSEGGASDTSWVARISRSSRYWTKMSAITGPTSPTMKVPHAVAMAFAFFDETITAGYVEGAAPPLGGCEDGKKKMFCVLSKGRARSGIPHRTVICGAFDPPSTVSRAWNAPAV